jgi:hypothetical protein
MLCRGSVQEPSGRKSCWLPADPFSKYQLCRRCHFHKITDTMDHLTQDYRNGSLHPCDEPCLRESWFLEDMLHPGREQALLNLLSALFSNNKIMFFLLLDRFKKKSVFSILLTKRIQAHTPGTRCCMYRRCFQESGLYNAETLPWNCWPCISWILHHTELPLHQIFQREYTWGLRRLTHPVFLQTGPQVFISLLSTFQLRGMEAELRLFFLHCLFAFPLEEVKQFVLLAFQDPLLLPSVFSGSIPYLPVPLQDEGFQKTLYLQWKTRQKERIDALKCELVEKTWHPKRLFRWCLDVEELVEFGFTGSNDERILEDVLLD